MVPPPTPSNIAIFNRRVLSVNSEWITMSPESNAFIFTGIVFAASLAWIFHCLFRGPFTPPQMIFHYAAMILARVQWRAELPGRLPLPEKQGCVVVANHRSSIDPFFLQAATERKIHWLVAKEFFAQSIFGFFLRLAEAIPTNRGGSDTSAIRQAIQYLRQGEVIGMLPEGRINLTERLLLPVRPGAVHVALKAGVPLVPCYIAGAPYRRTPWSPFFMRARAKVFFGDPIDTSIYSDREVDGKLLGEITLRVMKEIARLAGQPDFEPELAPRNWKPTPDQVAADQRAHRLKERANAK